MRPKQTDGDGVALTASDRSEQGSRSERERRTNTAPFTSSREFRVRSLLWKTMPVSISGLKSLNASTVSFDSKVAREPVQHL